MYKEKFMDLFTKVPKGVWLLALGLSVQFSPVLTYKIKGGSVVCLIYAIGALFCVSKDCREGFFSAVIKAIKDNGWKCTLLLIFYIVAVAAWFYAPYDIGYKDIQHIWKKMLLNIVAIFIGLFLSRYPQFIKTIVICCIPCALYHVSLMNSIKAIEGLDARSYLGDGGGGGILGTFQQWEPIAMLSVMLLSVMMTFKNIVVKILLGVLVFYFSLTILRAGYATPFALLLIGFAIMGVGYMRYGSSRKKGIIMRMIFGAIMLFVVGMIFFSVVKSAETGETESVSIAMRFHAFLNDPKGGGYSSEHSRFSLMEIGWESFCESPIFGRGGEYPSSRYETVGGHHALIDFLGMYGIVGGGAYILFMLITLRYLYQRYRKTREWMDCSKMAVSVMFFVGGVVNPGWVDLPVSAFFVFCAPFSNQYLLRSNGIFPNERYGEYRGYEY